MIAMDGERPWVAGLCRVFLASLALLLVQGGCAPAPSEPEVRREIKDLKAEVAALQAKLNQLEAGQQAILEQLKKPAATPPEATASLSSPAPHILTVSQLLENKDRYLGTRVTVRGLVGPVLVHRKSLLLLSPQGMVEVFFDKLADQNQVQRLTSTNLDLPITVTGVVSLPPKGGGAKLQVNAEAVEF